MLKSRISQTVLWVLILGFPVAAFQNCSGVLHFGNGGGYEGGKTEGTDIQDKPTYTYQTQEPLTAACPDGRPRNALVLTEGNYLEAQVQRRDCENVSAAPRVGVIASSERPVPRVIVYRNQVYDLVDGSSTSPKAVVFCTVNSPNGSRELLITKPAALTQGDSPYNGRISIFTSAGTTTGDIGLLLIQGAEHAPNGAVYRGENPASNSYLQLTIDNSRWASYLDYRLTMVVPPGASFQDPIFGAYLGGGQFTNIISPLACYTPYASPTPGTGGAGGQPGATAPAASASQFPGLPGKVDGQVFGP